MLGCLARAGCASEVYPPSATRRGTNRCEVFRRKNRSKFDQNSYKIIENPKNAPKSAQERHKGRASQPCSALGAVLSRSWDAPGPPRTRPGPSKTQPGAPKCEPKAIFNAFFRILFSRRFSYRFFYAKVRNDLYRNLENKRFASTGARFSQNRFFRLATKIYRKITSKTLRFESQNRKKT